MQCLGARTSRIPPEVVFDLEGEVEARRVGHLGHDRRGNRSDSVADPFDGYRPNLLCLCLRVLADRVGTNDLLTLDERHFRAVGTGDGGAFRLLPSDG